MKWLDTPPVWLVAFLAIGWFQSRWFALVDFGGWAPWLGGLLTLAGGLIFVEAVYEFIRHRTPITPGEWPTDFITSGVFRFSRNPIYLGDALILTGLSLWWDAILSLLLVPVFVRLISRRFIVGEEGRLRARFGAAFEEYRSRVRRWI